MLHFLHIFLVFRLHTLQCPCGPVPRIWFAPSKRISGNCDIKPDSALGGAVRSDCSKLRTTCRRNSRWAEWSFFYEAVNPPSSHCRNVHRIDKQRPIPFFASYSWTIGSSQSVKMVTSSHTNVI
ncbi:hypothetical protein T10_1698 [Trichinella papuae]|uniref:Secreted protein n=1 Tax=Trichinella papuae TaxID=268474 RepID=A0A0V1N3M5_9BILA|nr:hypothetical protein T10_5585 [Trichinella papuae]KRZ80707.1 hypothetical protein T10_1698 [Trichinella papuae]